MRHLVLFASLIIRCLAGNWYDNIPSVKVFSPSDDVGAYAWNLFDGNMETAQFSDKRYALLLKRGNYEGAEIAVGYYTSIIGLGEQPSDVVVGSFWTRDNPDVGNACDNFWRHVEGMTTTRSSVQWAASQAAPLRRVHIKSELWLSEGGSPHWSSGGFLSDSTVDGPLRMGTQQQYLVRNTKLNQGAVGTSKNYVFVGVQGAPASASDGTITTVHATPRVAVKPFLTENNGTWQILVPQTETNTIGPTGASCNAIDFEDVFVAKEGDTADTINAGIQGKKALLITPAIYGLSKSIAISTSNFVVLGIGFPTLVATNGNSALVILAEDVRVAGVLLEAGTPVSQPTTEPLLVLSGDRCVASDIFSRSGAFSYSRGFKPSCLKTRADVHVKVYSTGAILDNCWLWHADHDDCASASDDCFSRHGLVVMGADVIAYGMKAEHMFKDILLWYGEGGQVYLFQAELPYHVSSYPTAAYTVEQNVSRHMGFGIGTYQVGTYTVDTGARVPPTAQMTNVLTWCITGSSERFRSVVCTSETGVGNSCYFGDRCTSNSCYVYNLPRAGFARKQEHVITNFVV